MRFNLLNLLALVTIVSLIVALCLKRTPDKLLLIGGEIDTWELKESASLESQWLDESQEPQLSVSETFQIAQSICTHLNSAKETTGVGFWEPVTVSFERLLPVDDNRWAYFLRLEGSDYPGHPGQSIVQQITCMILLDKTIVFDSGSCPDELCAIMKSHPKIVDGAPTVNERPAREGGVF